MYDFFRKKHNKFRYNLNIFFMKESKNISKNLHFIFIFSKKNKYDSWFI